MTGKSHFHFSLLSAENSFIPPLFHLKAPEILHTIGDSSHKKHYSNLMHALKCYAYAMVHNKDYSAFDTEKFSP